MKALALIVIIAGLLTGCAHFGRLPLSDAVIGRYSLGGFDVSNDLQLNADGRYWETVHGPLIVLDENGQSPPDPVSDQGWAEASRDRLVLHSDRGGRRVFSIIAGPPLILREHTKKSTRDYRRVDEPSG
tara:strand:+ start:86 stop:472 length:387 start_codon:yes stop_codon:yes gene_type:complete